MLSCNKKHYMMDVTGFLYLMQRDMLKENTFLVM